MSLLVEEDRRTFLSRRVSQGMDNAAAEGRPVGMARIGYVRASDGYDTFDPSRRAAVLLAFRLALDPENGLRAVLRELVQAGLTGSRGNLITVSSLRHVLRDPYYAGRSRYKGTVRIGTHRAYVTREEFDRIQDNMGWPENKMERRI
jgi:hypothetical protein